MWRGNHDTAGPLLGYYDWLEELHYQIHCEDDMEGEVVISSTGATSTKLEEAWHLIPFSALQSMARRFWYGSQKHAPRNWEKGDDAFAEVRLSHCCRHMALFAEHRRQEDLDAVLCNAAMLAWFKEKGFLSER